MLALSLAPIHKPDVDMFHRTREKLALIEALEEKSEDKNIAVNMISWSSEV